MSGPAGADFFVLRAPLLPLELIDELGEGLTAPAAACGDDGALERALAADRVTVRQRLARLLDRPDVIEALFVASPSTVQSLEHWSAEPDSERGRKVERTVLKYITRMCTRPTPFGLFAACSLGRLGPTSQLDLDVAPERLIRRTRLDGDYLFRLCEAVAADQAIRAELPHVPNSSLYSGGARLRYAEAQTRKQARHYELVAVEPTPYLEATLERARAGALPGQLAEPLADSDPDIQPEEAEAFVAELIDTQILVPRLSPPVTGGDALAAILGDLAVAPAAGSVVDTLERVRGELASLDGRIGNPVTSYQHIASTLEQLPAKVELQRLFQVDAARPGNLSLGPRVVRELDRAVALLARFDGGDDSLRDFREAFLERYEGREVPLTEVLDEELGIGTGRGSQAGREAPLLQTIPMGQARADEAKFGERHQWLLRRLHDCHRDGRWDIELGEDDIARLTAKEPRPLPDAFAVMATIEARSAEAIDAGDFIAVIDGMHGPSGANLIGRFCHLGDDFTEAVRQHLRGEEAHRPDAIYAEVAHLPQGRIGNVLLRPVLRDYEIPFMARPSVAGDRQIPVQDLLVGVRYGRVVLRSMRLGREVLPRLTTAHNFASADNLSLYRFLCAVQRQHVSDTRFSWGPLADAPRLPRVRLGRLVLSRAKWRLQTHDVEGLVKSSGSSRFRAAQDLRQRHQLPRHVAVQDGDNVLLIDLDSTASIDVFAHHVRRAPYVDLIERWSTDQTPVRGDGRAYAHELVIPYVTSAEPAADRPQSSRPAVGASASRLFVPGSPWLYAKLYCGEGAADWLLSDVVRPTVEELRQGRHIDRWFFIRYGDPRWHLRVRFHGRPDELLGQVLPALQKAIAPALEDGRIWRFEIDTYQREIERYGGEEAMPLCEAVFGHDSDAVVELLEYLWGEGAREARWRVAAIGADRLLDDLGFTAEQKLEQATLARNGYAAEMKLGSAGEKALGDKFRPLRTELEALLDPGASGGDYAPAYEIYQQRSQACAPIVAELHRLEAAGQLTRSRMELADSLIHMHINRLLRSAQRTQEMVIYDFLARIYRSRAARARGSSRPRRNG